MIDARLALALSGGGLDLPLDGQIAVFYPSPEIDLTDLPQDRTVVVQGFKPAFDTWERRGFHCEVAIDAPVALCIVCLPRSKVQARTIIAEAMRLSQGPVVIDGQKTDGVDSMLREMRKRADVSAPISKAHGKLFWCQTADPDAFAEWQAGPALTAGGFWTAPGVFSADGIDPASDALAAVLPAKLGRRVGDLGAGWGFLSAHASQREDVQELHLVEAEFMALECARRNVGDPRAHFHWADATTWAPEQKLDTVIMNPPFHNSRAADPALGQSFVRSAARVLSPQGQLWMVANRHLPYEEALKACFARVEEIGGDARFKLFHAARPKKGAR